MADNFFSPTALGNERKGFMESNSTMEMERELRRIRKDLKKMIRLMLYSLSLEEERLQQQQFSLFDPDPISPDIFFMQKKKKRAKRKDRWV